MTYEELKKEYDNPAFRRKVKESYPKECANCGSKENIEYHHIVPLKLGGTNRVSNIIPLCHRCHKAAHCGQEIVKYQNWKSGGRPIKADPEKYSDVFDAYVKGEIGRRKCLDLIGCSRKSTVESNTGFKRYMEMNGIAHVHNTVDIVGTISPMALHDGVVVGNVEYTDGHSETLFFKETGENNISYEYRSEKFYR